MVFGERKKTYLVFGALCFVLVFLVVRQLYLVSVVSAQRDNESIVSTESYVLPYSKNDPSYGNPGAPSIVAIFSDMSCVECQKIVNEVYNFVTEHPRDIRLVWFDAPKNGLLVDRVLPHKAARCALAQDAFWPYIQNTFAVSGNYRRDFLEEQARRVGLNIDAWSNCLALKETAESARAGSLFLDQYRITSVPAVFINNKRITLVKGINITSILTQVITPVQ